MNLKGAFTAIVTPFSRGAVDYAKLKDLVEIQIEAGIDGIVPVGTTGESPTLSCEEHLKTIETVVQAADKRCLVIAGTGANSTEEAVELTKKAKEIGADASLQVTPYYNKPTQEGLYRHFSTVIDETEMPIVVYNIPGRSGVPVEIETVVRLSKNEKVIAVKEAGGSVERVSATLAACDITILGGDDPLTLPMMAVGASGVISVASNIIPAEVKALTNAMLSKNLEEAMRIHKKYFKFFKSLFIETNPVPIKAALAMKGVINEEYRLPLCPMAENNRKILEKTLREIEII